MKRRQHDFGLTDEDPCVAGDTFRRSFQFIDRHSESVDLSGWLVRMHIRQEIDSETAEVELEVGDGITIEGSKALVHITPEQTAALNTTASAITYRYDLELETPAGDIGTPLYGKFKVSPQVTR